MDLIAYLLLALSIGVLAFQMMLMRQVGLLRLRAAPLVDEDADAPDKTSLAELPPLEGAPRVLGQYPQTVVLMLTTTCAVCRPVLESIGPHVARLGILVGMKAGDEADIRAVSTHHGLPLTAVFPGGELHHDLRIRRLPTLLVLDETGRVRRREFVASLDEVLRATPVSPESPSRGPTDRDERNGHPTVAIHGEA
jgi:hypothetical protein